VCDDVVVYGGTLTLECQSFGDKLTIGDLEKVSVEYCMTVLCGLDVGHN
jgi:hypothetical protein